MFNRVVSFALVVLPALWALRWLRRAIFAKDYAYAVKEAFGQGSGSPPRTRIRKRMPWLATQTVDSWLPDFASVNVRVDELARAGGPQRLGWRQVKSDLRKDFPFLRFEGLGRATALTAYLAMHEGWDKSPEK